MKKIILLCTMLMAILGSFAQNLADLQSQKDELEKRIAVLKAELDKVDGEIKSLTPVPVWTTGFAGTVGFNFNQLNNWVVNPNPNARTSNILISTSSFANLNKDKYFWRNNGFLNLGWQKLQLDSNVDEGSEYQPNVDVLQLTSLFGYRLSKTIATSALGQFRSSVIRNAFNPAYLDLGIGATWKPSNYFVAVFHPLNYNIIFAEEGSQFQSSLGCMVVADYNRAIVKGINLRSNWTSFLSYRSLENLSNITWTNGINFNLIKGFGVGLEYALRWNRQETINSPQGHYQSYFILGLSYSI